MAPDGDYPWLYGNAMGGTAPLATQKHIVAEIEAEQALVAANRELVTCFERKIEVTLVRVWEE